MSFNNTKAKKLSQCDPSKKIFNVSRRTSGGRKLYLTPELEKKLRELYPFTTNADLMDMFGISGSTLHRFAREMSLKKDMTVIYKLLAKQIKNTCQKNGYYRSIKGKKPSEACIEATRKKRAEGYNPLKRLKEIDPAKYKRYLRKQSRIRKKLIKEEARRYDIGLMPLSNLDPRFYSGEKLDKYELYARWWAKKFGYVPGKVDPDMGERHVVYYTPETRRRERFERNATAKGFEFRALPAARVTKI